MPNPPHALRAFRSNSILLLLLALATACGGGGGGGGEPPTPPSPPAVASVQVTGSESMYIGATQQLSAIIKDAAGNVLSGRTVVWSSTTNNAAGSVSPTGAVTATFSGSVTVTATSEGRSGSIVILVTPVPVASVTITPPTATVALTGTAQFVATPKDSIGGSLPARPATWTSSATGVATVSTSGLVTGVSAGTATIRATMDSKLGEATVTVTSTSPPKITSVAPSVLTPGISATITGTDFSAVPAQNAVTVDGVSATVTSAATTSLVITVPALPCTPSHTATIGVTVGGLAGAGSQTVRAGAILTVAANAPLLLSTAEARCAELPAGAGQYLVSVFNTAQIPTAITPFRFYGTVNASASASPLAQTGMYVRQATAFPSRSSSRLAAGDVGSGDLVAQQLHDRILESNRAVLKRMRAAGAQRARRAGVARSRTAAAAALPTVGMTRKFRIAQFSTNVNAAGSCNEFVEITARVVYVGTHGIVYEDAAAPLAGKMDSYYRALGAEFDDSMYPVDLTYFGDPLVTDQFTDADQHLSMVFTPSITEGVAGFVNPCDFFPRNTTDDQVSNFGEFFYAVVPTAAGTGFNSNTADAWRRSIRATLVHEVKHIASLGARFVNNADDVEESWLEEGLARHAEELWQRSNVYHVAWKANSPYATTLYCDVRPTFPQCADAPIGMFDHFATLYDVLDQPGAFSLFGRVADGDFNFYASSWSFTRWALDRHASSEASFLRGITQAVSTTGTASIVAQTGRPIAELLTNWSLSLYLDDATALTNPDFAFPTWNTRDIYAGLNHDFASKNFFLKPFPLTPQDASANTFTMENAGIHGGSFAMYLVSGSAAGPRAIRLSGAGGVADASTSLRLALVKLP